jgi:hypothetical protein
MLWPFAGLSFARDTGAPLSVRLAINLLTCSHVLAGELATVTVMIEEDHLIGEVTRVPPIAVAEMMLAAWRGQDAQLTGLIGTTLRQARAGGIGRLVDFAAYARPVLYNGLGRHHGARDAAWQAFERDHLGFGPFVVPELAEATSRSGDIELVRAALAWLSERSSV